MTTSHDLGSAKIYQFPARGRFAVVGQREEKSTVNTVNTLTPRVARVAFGSSWYHDEAIEEAERAGTH